MQMHLEHPQPHTIQAYTDHCLTINDKEYCQSVIISQQEIITDIKIKSLQAINESIIDQLMQFEPKIIVIGHTQTGKLPPPFLYQALEKKQTGVECMSLGAACRTWNVLIGEDRAVVALMIFPDYPVES